MPEIPGYAKDSLMFIDNIYSRPTTESCMQLFIAMAIIKIALNMQFDSKLILNLETFV